MDLGVLITQYKAQNLGLNMGAKNSKKEVLKCKFHIKRMEKLKP